MTFVVPVTAGSDWHCGWSTIPATMTVKIAEYKISVTFGDLEVLGNLFIEGTLVIEA